MQSKSVTVDFEKRCGRIKPLFAVNGAPRSGGAGLLHDFSEEFVRMRVPAVRVGAGRADYGYNQFLNVHSIFPDPNADETLEESYNFLPTDLYLASVKNVGAEIFYCFGEAAEPYSRKLYVKCPEDKHKWARICEHILMHYNEAWANGFKWGIKHVEIWSSPDTPEGFSDSKDEYFELYRVVSNHLRERFPKLKIGAYGAGGFYALNRIDATEQMKGYVPYMQAFLSYISKENTSAPLDFFTWNCHTSSPEELSMHAKYARTYLGTAGFKRTRSIICSYNSQSKGAPLCLKEGIASELCASLILAQKSSADMMIYSSTDAYSPENALFSVDDRITHRHYASYDVAVAFSELYRIGTAVETTADFRKEVYTLAASNGKEGAILVAVRNYRGKLEIALKNSPYKTCSVTKLSQAAERGACTAYRADNVSVVGSKIIISAGEYEVFLVKLF